MQWKIGFSPSWCDRLILKEAWHDCWQNPPTASQLSDHHPGHESRSCICGLWPAITQCTALRTLELNFSDNNVNTLFASKLANAIASLSGLRRLTLCLDNNFITQEGAYALFRLPLPGIRSGWKGYLTHTINGILWRPMRPTFDIWSFHSKQYVWHSIRYVRSVRKRTGVTCFFFWPPLIQWCNATGSCAPLVSR